jgi:sec-independent protein translocase protein TatA
MSGSHLMLLAVVLIVLILGPAKLPQLGRGLGDAIRGFKKGMAGEDDNEIDITNTTREKLHNSPTEAEAQAQKERERNKV